MIPADVDDDCICTATQPCYYHFIHGGVPVVRPGRVCGVQLDLFTGAEVEARWVACDEGWTCARCGRVVVGQRPAPCGCGRVA